jgi:heme/copper-type cytochrome/quinol oxidase subunit 4
MLIIITIEFIMIVSSIPFELKLVAMFFHIGSIREFKILIQSWVFTTFVVILVVLWEEKIIEEKNN